MFGSIDVRVRPIRLAYLIDPNSAAQVRDAITLSSTLWGGSYFPIVPLYRRMPTTWRDGPIKAPSAKDVTLGYVKAFDPDVLVQYAKEIPSYVTNLGLRTVKPDEIWESLEPGRNCSPKFGLGIFELLDDVFEEHFKYRSKYPVRVILPRIPKEFSLFWASLFGEVPLKVQAILAEHYREPLELETVDIHSAGLPKLLRGNVLAPRRLSQRGLSYFNRSGLGRDGYVYFLDATKIDDVIDFWNLRAIGKRVVPIPKQLKGDPHLKEIVVEFLKTCRRPWNHNPKVCDYASMVRARNCTMEELQEYAKTIAINPLPGDPSDDPFFSLQHWYPRIWDEWARDKDGVIPADIYGKDQGSIEVSDTKELQFRFKPLLPHFADKAAYHGEPRCANEVSFRFYGSDDYLAEALPQASGDKLVRAIAGMTSFRDWRIGRNGLVKLVKDDFTETRDIPTAENIMFAWLADLGWKPQLSPPGMLAKQIYRRFDGDTTVLQNERFLGLLEHMNGGSVKRDGSPAIENKIGQERELSVGEVKSRLTASSQRGDIYRLLLAKDIFRLGPRMQCPKCLRHSWYSLEDVEETFTCPKCQDRFSAIGNLDGATWCYKTAGPFSVPGYADGAYAVLLTLGFFDNHRMHALRRTPVVSFTAEAGNRKALEADLALFWEESLYGERKDGILFGECKTYGQFDERDFDRMRYVAHTFPGAILVFSTLRKTLTPGEIAQIRRIAKTGRKYWKAERPINPVMILTGTELLSWLGPPYCWEESVKKKFDRVAGLLSSCDATQQIYLNLPSWQSEWHESWERRRHRRALRQRP